MNVTLTEILDLVDSAAELEELMIGATSIIAMFIDCNDDDAPTFTFLPFA